MAAVSAPASITDVPRGTITMKVTKLMSLSPHTCRPEDSLERAAQLFWEHDCGVLPVVDEKGRAIAAITDRDVCMSAYTKGARLADLRVGSAMSSTLVSCRADEELTLAAQRMVEHGVRRLPVVDAVGSVVGVLSLNDIARAAGDDKGVAREAVRVLTAVCRRRGPRARAAPSRSEGQRSSGVEARQPPANAPRAAVLTSSLTDAEC
jgi:CBS domain-containing protein